MITIFSKKAFRFRNPNPNAAIITPPPPPKKGLTAEQNAMEAAKQVAADSSNLGKKTDEPAFFDTKPGEIQQAPDWIKTDPMWHWATADGDLMEIVPQKEQSKPSKKSGPTLDQQAQIAQMANNPDTQTEEEKNLQKTAPPGASRKKLTS